MKAVRFATLSSLIALLAVAGCEQRRAERERREPPSTRETPTSPTAKTPGAPGPTGQEREPVAGREQPTAGNLVLMVRDESSGKEMMVTDPDYIKNVRDKL